MEFKTIVIGRVGRDAELKFTKDGKAVCSYSVATNPQKDKTVWVKVTTWDKRAELDGQYVKKGMLVKVEGTLQSDENGKPRTYQDSSGTTLASNFELTGFDVKYLSKPESNGVTQESTQPTFEFNTETEDIPF